MAGFPAGFDRSRFGQLSRGARLSGDADGRAKACHNSAHHTHGLNASSIHRAGALVLLMRFRPVWPEACIHYQWHRQVDRRFAGILHDVAHHCNRLLQGLLGHFEDQFVMDL